VENHQPGKINLIVGCMFAGKTKLLIQRLQSRSPNEYRVVKPTLDGRYGHDRIVSHDGDWLPAIEVSHTDPEKILSLVQPGVRMVGIDEIQFFSPGLVPVVQTLAQNGLRVLLAGLDLDYRGEPFGSVPALQEMAHQITFTMATCRCGRPANRTQRIIQGAEQILVGGKDAYEPRCRQCFEPPPAPSA